MELSQYAELFLAESREHLQACNQLLLEWERSPAAGEPVAGLFRAVHTIKGMAATMGYAGVAQLAHRAENLLDALRRGGRAPDQAVLDLLFRTLDRLEQTITAAVRGQHAKPADDLALELDRVATGLTERRISGPVPPIAPAAPPPPSAGPTQPGRVVRVVLRPDAQLKGARAAVVLGRAAVLGAVSDVQPAPHTLETDEFDGRFSFTLDSAGAADDIAADLRTAGDVAAVEISAARAAPDPTGERRQGELGRGRHVRVDIRHLDALMNLAGELVIGRGRLAGVAARRQDPELEEVQSAIGRLTGELQGVVVQARLTPVWQLFDRFPRLVRDLSRELDKEVVFRVEGKDIELDRAILDEIGDALVHLLRNAVDHGIEPPEERRRRGKPREGNLLLAAVRERNSVAIQVSDDGRGIDRQAVLALAKREGLVDRNAEALPDDLVLRLVSRPGFTTAEAVSEVSGRGVGIDAVLTRLRGVGGSLELRSSPQAGTAFTMRLPVTLVVLRALLAQVGDERYALPLTHVAETLELDAAAVTTVGGGDAVILRDRVLPLVHLDRLLGVTRSNGMPSRRPVIVLEVGDRRTGVVVDGVVGQQEIVVKGFTAPQGTLRVFSGATVLGDGMPALILDAGGLV
jgi:two-component system chemotaxis sensor kinase CheA